MTSVGVRELKAKLSSFVQRAESGESIVITDHGRPVARLTPLTGADTLDALIESGIATRAATAAPRPTPEPITAGPVSDLVADQRR